MDGKISVFGNETLSDELSLLILLENDMDAEVRRYSCHLIIGNDGSGCADRRGGFLL